MVVIIMVLASIVIAFAIGLADDQQPNKTVMIVAKKIDTTKVTLTIYGGNNVQDITYLSVKVNQRPLSRKIGWKNVGDTITLDTSDGITGSNDNIVVKGYFADNTEQILLDTHI